MGPERRTLGRTGATVSALGFGAWAIGGQRGWGYGPTDDDTSRRALAQALDLGCSLVDVADSYGNGHAEELVGEVVERRRDAVILATKVGFDFYQDSSRQRFDPDYLRFAAEQSLRRLRTGRIDLYQLHCPPPGVMRDPAVAEALASLRAAGKVRWTGVSAASVPDAIAAVLAGGFDTVQVAYNLLAPEAGAGLFGLARAHGVAVLVREPLANGMLAGKYHGASRFPPGDVRSLWSPAELAEVCRRVEGLRPFCRPDESLAQLAIRFALEAPEVSAVLVGAKTPEQVRETFGARPRTLPRHRAAPREVP